MRLNYGKAAPEAIKALAAVNVALLNAGLDKPLRDLLFLRVSQINGCAYCVDEHARDLRQAGETAAYEPLKRHYDEKQIANITYAIALMNAWNRIAIGFHQGPVPRAGARHSD